MLQEEKRNLQESGSKEQRRKMHENELKHKRRIKTAFLKMSLMAMLLIVSTYAWFTSQKDITLSNLRGTVEVAENMEISLDAKTWHQEIDLSEAANVFAEAQTSRDKALGEDTDITSRTTAPALLPIELLPVSGVGEKSGVDMPLYGGKATSTKLTEIAKKVEINPTTKEANENGYFAFDIYVKNTSKDGEYDVLQLNLNSAVQVLTNTFTKIVTDGTNITSTEYTGDAASGLQNTVRVGLALYEGTESSTATQLQILNATKDSTIKDIAIWEPNASDHVEYIVSNNNKLVNGTDTVTDLSFEATEQVTTYALNAGAVTAGTIENVYDITSTGLGVQKTFKTEKTSASDYRIATSGSPLDIKNITEQDFKIKSNAVSRIRVYVWLEGQDVDCINIASQGGGIELDLGFTKDGVVGEVMEGADLAELDLDVGYEVTGASEVKVTVRSEKDLVLPDGWNYETVTQAASAGEVYRVASAEPIRLGATTINKKAIYKVFTADGATNIKVRAADGSENILQFSIKNVASGSPSMVETKYDIVKETTGNVTVTIDAGTKIQLPTGWEYVDSNQTTISKVYSENKTENVTVKDEAGNVITTEEVKVENIKVQTNTMTLAEVTNDNIGDYINLGNDIVDYNGTTGVKTDDWRILYVENNTVYAILSSYLPNSTNYASNAGLVTTDDDDNALTYSVRSTTDRAALLAGLTHSTAWNGLANGIEGATVVGAIEGDFLMKSYNEKNNCDPELNYEDYPTLDSSGTNNLYVPHTEEVDRCFGYWLASPLADCSISVWFVSYYGYVSSDDFIRPNLGVRPVVSLPSDIPCSKVDGIWTVEN